MKKVLLILIAALIIGSAGWILISRLIRFIRTKGRSGCSNCPYHSGCSGDCDHEK